MTVYDFAKELMEDENFNSGGIIDNEKDYLDAIGFKYKLEEDGTMTSGRDLKKFYKAMYMLYELNKKYK